MNKFLFSRLGAAILLLFSFQWTHSQTTEICGNGIDDDLNGFVDYFDSACVGGISVCNLVGGGTSCEFVPLQDSFELQVKWASSRRITAHSPLAVGDFDGDCIPEIVVKYMTSSLADPSATDPLNRGSIRILDGRTGMPRWAFNFPGIGFVNNGFLIADANDNGRGELYYINPSSGNLPGILPRHIICFEYDGNGSFTQLWQSSHPVGQSGFFANYGGFHSVDIADFNQDGIPELYSGNKIFNAITGVQLSGNITGSIGLYSTGTSHPAVMPVAADVLNRNDVLTTTNQPCGPLCDGLELLAGDVVYAVSANNATITIASQVNDPFNQIGDGATSVADVDLDGRLDVVSSNYHSSSSEIYCWNPRTGAIIGQRRSIGTGGINANGRICIADFDSDGFPEFGMVTRNTITVMDHVTTSPNSNPVLWDQTIADGSGMTGLTVFDFDGDGASEVVYRGETNLHIFDGATGAILGTRACRSATAAESPIVVDVDADGRTEILCGCDDLSSYNGYLYAFESANNPWVASRTIWNQQAYFNVNIDDDMGVPIQQQGHHLQWPAGHHPLNTFLAQSPLLDNDGYARNPAADATLRIISVICDGPSYQVSYEVCNRGSLSIPVGMSVSFYSSDPHNSSNPGLLGSFQLPIPLAPNDCQVFSITLTGAVTSIFGLANQNGQGPFPLSPPYSGIGECNYSNNFDSTDVDCSCSGLNLNAFAYYNTNGPTVTFTDQSTGGSISYIHWDFGDGTTAVSAQGATVSHTYSSVGPFLVCATANAVLPGNLCCHDEFCFQVQIDTCAFLQAAFSSQPAGPPQRTYRFTDLSTPGGSISRWDFGDGQTGISGGSGSSILHTYANVGLYMVQLITTLHVSDTVCCSDTVKKYVRITNGNGGLALYPTVSSSTISVEHEFEGTGAVEIRVVSLSGEVVHAKTVQGIGILELDVTNLPSGAYTVTGRQGEVESTAKFVRE